MGVGFWETIKGVFSILWQVWPVLVLILVILITKIIIETLLPQESGGVRTDLLFNKKNKWKTKQEHLFWIRGLSAEEFQSCVLEVFKRMGYTVSPNSKAESGKIDVVVIKNGLENYIQCRKYFQAHEVGVNEVKDFYETFSKRSSNGEGYLVTTGKFSSLAEEFAKEKTVELVDGTRLLEYIQHINQEERKEESTCPNCKGSLIKRTRRYGSFIECENYPRCGYKEKI